MHVVSLQKNLFFLNFYRWIKLTLLCLKIKNIQQLSPEEAEV